MNKNLKVKIPSSKGLVFIKAIRVKVKDIKPNPNSRTLKFRFVKKFQKAIRNKTLNNELNIPPCVSEKLELESGNHQYNAHVLENQEYMIVAVVKFIDFENKPAKYWQEIWQSVENNDDNDEFIRNPRDDEQIIQTAVNLIDKKLINQTEIDVKNCLKDQQVKPDKFNYFLSKILNDKSNSPKICKVYNSTYADDFINKNYKVVLSTPKKIVKNTDDAIYFKQQFTKENDDKVYDNRVFDFYVKSILKYPSSNIKVFSYVDSINPNHIIAVRNAKKKLIQNKISMYRQFIKLYDEKKIKDLEFINLPQLVEEVKNNISNDTK